METKQLIFVNEKSVVDRGIARFNAIKRLSFRVIKFQNLFEGLVSSFSKSKKTLGNLIGLVSAPFYPIRTNSLETC